MTFNWEDVRRGTVVPAWTPAPVTRSDIVRYQGASGDFDPAHHDDDHARQFGYPGVFSLGMLHAGILTAWLAKYFPPGRIRRFRARFVSISYPGEVLTYRGKVVELRCAAEQRWADLELLCEALDERVVVRAWASILLANDE